jgi:hypothetical protein
MKGLLLGLLVRFARGERYKNAPSMEARCQWAVFAFFPILIGSCLCIVPALLPGANGAMLCLSLLACFLFACLATVVWAVFVPLKASRIASIVLWILLIWAVAHLDLQKFTF